MTPEEFEVLLDKGVAQLNEDVRLHPEYRGPDEFQKRCFDVLKLVAKNEQVEVSPSFHPHAFPDITANGFGVEVKTVKQDSWLSVGNSVFEGMRDPSVKLIYVVFGKMGGMPAVKWGRYEERVTHVRISHAPRFVVEMDRDSSLFDKMAIGYDAFAACTAEDKMQHIRKYTRSRLKKGEKIWWLEDEQGQGLDVRVKLYMNLPAPERIRLRAEAALLCPEIVGSARDKYANASLYLLTFHGVLAPQTRDLFGAGSAAKPGKAKGVNYVLLGLLNIEAAMREAAQRLDDALFVEYWEEDPVPVDQRIKRWLQLADGHAKKWKPSKHLFLS
jgi:hypothetical protein